jgi:LPXTG-site transpeptidase (sortase) family protein
MKRSRTGFVRLFVRKALRRKAFARTTIGALAACAVVLTVVDVVMLNVTLAAEGTAVAGEAAVVTRSAALHAIAPGTVGAPARIRIPRIAVNAVVVKAGLAKDGSMGVPKRPKDVAWYTLGPKPGEVGSSVIAGHLDWLYGATGAFKRLKTLKPGDTINVQDDLGATVSFVVREIRTYDAAADATDVFVSKDGKSHLNLVTCAGVWDRRAKQYTKRLIVFTDRVTE